MLVSGVGCKAAEQNEDNFGLRFTTNHRSWTAGYSDDEKKLASIVSLSERNGLWDWRENFCMFWVFLKKILENMTILDHISIIN